MIHKYVPEEYIKLPFLCPNAVTFKEALHVKDRGTVLWPVTSVGQTSLLQVTDVMCQIVYFIDLLSVGISVAHITGLWSKEAKSVFRLVAIQFIMEI